MRPSTEERVDIPKCKFITIKHQLSSSRTSEELEDSGTIVFGCRIASCIGNDKICTSVSEIF